MATSRRGGGIPRVPRTPKGETRGKAYIDLEMVGNTDEIYHMLRGLDSAFSIMGMNAFFVGKVTPYFRQRAAKRFANEGDDVVGKWAPLAPATESIRASGIASGDFFGISPNHPINVRTHDLENYIVGGRGDILHSGASSALVYPQVRTPAALRDKMETAQKGRTRPSTPPRPVIGMNHIDAIFVLSALAFHIESHVIGAWPGRIGP